MNYRIVTDSQGNKVIETPLYGRRLIWTRQITKGCAFSEEERQMFHLQGLLPHRIDTIDDQLVRHYGQFVQASTNLAKHIMLSQLHEKNEVLFYRLIHDHIEEMLPIIYTPTVGEVVEQYSHEFRRSRGLYVSYRHIDQIDQLLDNWTEENAIDLIVATDGEGVLGIGDQGLGGMQISIAKLMVYSLLGGISPRKTIPVFLDVGTDNKELLDDPSYMGLRAPRIRGAEYDAFIDAFVQAVKRKFPTVFLHWEDFGLNNARRILDKYRPELCTFNDDCQGTGATALACLLSCLNISKQSLTDQRIVLFGAGTAGIGIADQILASMIRLGLPESEARRRFWLIDRPGLLHEGLSDTAPFHKPYLRPAGESGDLLSTVKSAKPTVLIGCSTVHGAFNEKVVRAMHSNCDQPIILPLSNPTTKAEADPADLLKWTDGKALIASGSPFPNTAQSNNAYVFPGIGLGVIAAKATRLTDSMIWAACEALATASPDILPPIIDGPATSKRIALAVATQARAEGLSTIPAHIDLKTRIDEIFWLPRYHAMRRVRQ